MFKAAGMLETPETDDEARGSSSSINSEGDDVAFPPPRIDGGGGRKLKGSADSGDFDEEPED